jgi:hypothetical protein
MLINKVWERKFNYSFDYGKAKIDPDEILSAKITVFPRFISGYVNEQRIYKIIQKECGIIPKHLNIKSFKEWPHNLGVIIVEIKFSYKLDNIPIKKDFDDIIPKWDMSFVQAYRKQISLLKEITSFFLAGLHLSFPTHSLMMKSRQPFLDGFVQVKFKNRIFASRQVDDAFMHEILIERDKIENLNMNFDGLVKIWHYDMWPLKRYLKALKSDQITMDNLLDLMYCLEGLFPKNASSDFIKTFCILLLCKNKKEAKSLKALLDLAFKLRNEMVHGSKFYDDMDELNLEGKKVFAEKVYWDMKTYLSIILIEAMKKIISNKEIRKIGFNQEDLINLAFEK